MPPTPARTSGLLLPTFSLRREGDLGIGDTLALREWIDWAADHGIGFLQQLPINKHGVEDSPYSAISSVALEPVYLALDPGEVPGLTAADLTAARAATAATAAAPLVDYAAVRTAKRHLLECAWSRWPDAGPEWHQEFASFRRAEASWLDDYCLFRWMMECHGQALTWDRWPDGCHTPDGARAFLARHRRTDGGAADLRLGFHAFVQWLCFRQWRAVRAHADSRGVKLMGDIPIGVSWHSCDVFFERELFHLDWFGGTPPESMFQGDRFLQQWGQNWGIPLYNWNRMARDGYEWWQRRIRRHTEFFQMFRIDHILGFYRIYAFPWHPSRNAEFAWLDADHAKALTGGTLPRWMMRPDDTPEHKAANLADGDPRLQAVAAAAGTAEMIAEDLGWVPEYVRPHLERLGIAGFRIPHWDRNEHNDPLPGDRFTECSFATYSTHDHDPINAIWNGCREAAAAGDGGAAGALHALARFANIPCPSGGRQWLRFTAGIQWRLIKALFDSRSRYAVLMVHELFGLEGRVNSPGSTGGTNWRFRLPWTLTEIKGHAALTAAGTQLRSIIGITRRG